MGYFRFIIIPIVSDTSGNIIDAINIIIPCINVQPNLAIIIISPISINGIIIIIAVSTLDCIIVYGFKGKVFNTSKLFPSNEIIELVIEVINDAATINTNRASGIYDFINSISTPPSFTKGLTIPSKFTAANIQPNMNNTNPNPAFVTNTGDDTNYFISFFIRAIVLLFVFTLYSVFDFFEVTFLALELILKYILLNNRIVIANTPKCNPININRL